VTLVSEVLTAVAAGAGSTAEVARRTGVTAEAADVALAALSSTGRIRRVLVFADACSTEGSSGWRSSGG